MPYPGGRKQLTAVFLSIQRGRGTGAAKAWYRKAQREGYAPVAKDDKVRVKKRKRTKVRHGKGAGYAAQRRAAELRRDPGDLVLAGRGSAAQERARDPGELYSRAGGKSKSKKRPNAKAPLGQGGRFAALEQNLQKKGARNPGGLAAYIGRRKYGKARFQKLARKGR